MVNILQVDLIKKAGPLKPAVKVLKTPDILSRHKKEFRYQYFWG